MKIRVFWTEEGLVGGMEQKEKQRLDLAATMNRWEAILRARLAERFDCAIDTVKSGHLDKVIIECDTTDELRAEHDNWLAAESIVDSVYNDGDFWCYQLGMHP